MTIIDVRTGGEYEEGHVKDAMLFDIMNMMEGKFPEINKDEDVLLYCESGNRAMMAEQMMKEKGYTNVKNGGGINDMSSNGFEMVN